MNILTLTTRNIYEEGGEKTLMLAKDKFLRKLGVNTYFYSFRRNFNIKNDTQLFNIICQKKTYSLFYKKKLIKKSLMKYINLYNINILVISGIWLYFLKEILLDIKQKTGVKISLDFQGAIEEIKEYKLVYNNKVLSEYLYMYMKKLENEFIKNVDGIEVVSNNAINYLKQEYKISQHKQFVIIPCGIENPLNMSEYNRERKKWRNIFNLREQDVGIVYAGGIHKWQRIKDIFQLIRNFSKFDNVKFFIFTSPHNQKFLKGRYRNLINKNLYFRFLPHEELEKALCAFDIGILFRYPDTTNYVAFPNKFSEYINARLIVLLKNKNIGCYPSGEFESFVKIINKDEDFYEIIRAVQNKDYKLYDKYIQKIAYNNTIKQLVNYYENLLKI